MLIATITVNWASTTPATVNGRVIPILESACPTFVFQDIRIKVPRAIGVNTMGRSTNVSIYCFPGKGIRARAYAESDFEAAKEAANFKATIFVKQGLKGLID